MKSTLIVIAIVILGSVGLIALVNKATAPTVSESVAQATIVDGKQIVEIKAKGGYAPRMTTAKAGIPTSIQVKTAGTFDCSAALTIPSIGYSTHLPPSGITTIEVPAQNANTKVQGICSMGMYSFTINFV